VNLSRLSEQIQSELNKKPIIIVGIVKDIGNTLKSDINNLSQALGFFNDIHWFLVESNSSDNSRKILAELKNSYPNFNYKSIIVDSSCSALRTESMATARNTYLAHLRDKVSPAEFPYVVIADFNLLNNKLSKESVLTSWLRNDWDIVTANQGGPYYDIWALRHPIWSPNDCWEQHNFIRNYVKFPEAAITFAIRSRMLKIPKKTEWIEVDSAFGGFAIYKTRWLLSQANYTGTDESGRAICEHVNFHKKLKEAGARIFINPGMINTNYTDHSRQITFFYTLFRFFQNLKKLRFKQFYGPDAS